MARRPTLSPQDDGPGTPAVDMVNHPPHYAGANGVECIDALEAMATEGEDPFEAHLRLTAVTYLWRLGRKGDALEDIDKALWYLQRLRVRLAGRQS